MEIEETIGQYGSGFLTTHLLSSKVNISGQIEDGRRFDFGLTREVGSVGALSESMRQAARDFEQSLSKKPEKSDFTTEFRYPLFSDVSEVVDAGITAIKKCAPFIIAFNPEFSAIRINTPNRCTEFSIASRSSLDQTRLELIVVLETDAGIRKTHEFILAHGHMTSVAIPIEPVFDSQRCVSIADTPKLFLGFPLIGTEEFPFPAIINSFRFTPTENRDGAHLGQSDSQANIDNQAAIEEASELLVRLIGYVASSGWEDIHRLAVIPSMQHRDWLNSDWLRKHFREYLIPEIRRTPMVLSERGAIAPEDAIIPFAKNDLEDESVETLWDLLNELTCFRQNLPRRSESVGWRNSVDSWADTLICSVSDLKEVSDASKLASNVEDGSIGREHEFGQVKNLQTLLHGDIGAIDWLNQFLNFLKNCGLDDVIRHRSIISDQAGLLRRLSDLHRDQTISKELKDIAESLDWRLRNELRNAKLTSLDDDVGAGDCDKTYVNEQLITRLRARAQTNLDDGFLRASVCLFAWIVGRDSWDLLHDFPAFAEEPESGVPVIIKLRSDLGDGARPLAPVAAWEKDLLEFCELFPNRYILASAFYDSVCDMAI